MILHAFAFNTHSCLLSSHTFINTHTHTHTHTVSGNPTVLTSLINSGSPASSQDINGATPLHYAAQEAREPSPLDAEAYTEQELARSQNFLQCISILIDNGVAADCTDQQGMQPLHWAVQYPCAYNYVCDTNSLVVIITV